jgi:serine/threonine protein phosphatase PrpC
VSFVLRFGARSDRGNVRPANQDSAYAGPKLTVVADGMGGMAAGDLASRLTISAVAPLDRLAVARSVEDPADTLVEGLQTAAEEANRLIRDEVAANPALEGMGTTLTAILLAGGKISMVHVGDSRGYRLRDGELQQVTKDDTYVQMLLDEGAIGPRWWATGTCCAATGCPKRSPPRRSPRHCSRTRIPRRAPTSSSPSRCTRVRPTT